MANEVFRHLHRVTYAECTMGNHIYYARYLDLLEAARGEFFRSLGTTLLHWQEAGTLFPVIECSVRFQAAARYDEVLAIEVWLSELGRVRLTFAHRIVNEAGREILHATTRHACTSLEEKPRRVPEELDRLLRPHLRPPSDQPARPSRTAAGC
jgi:YbgC/YbaW family acyl-CoA thioester hydrolase